MKEQYRSHAAALADLVDFDFEVLSQLVGSVNHIWHRAWSIGHNSGWAEGHRAGYDAAVAKQTKTGSANSSTAASGSG